MSATALAPRFAAYLRLIRFQHTLFALPFAYVGMLLAADGVPGWATLGWITLAMAGARTTAMALNRVIDARLDALNPRTRAREIPAGVIPRRGALALATLGLVAFALAGWALNPLTFALLPLATGFMVLYPYTKRFTWACHAVLGVTIGAAAAGGWIAVTGAFEPGAWWLWLAVAAWIAGFDVIYALLDEAFDRQHGVHSLPARFGAALARRAAMIAHALALVAFAATAWVTGQGAIGWGGLVLVAALFAYQHRLVAHRGVAEALRAFDANLWVGLLVLATVALDLARRLGSAGG
jgi:4-hydroxybenzoate polyprenyltransferase